MKREKPIPEFKERTVKEVVEKIKSSKTILLVSTKGLPASQFQSIKKKLRGKADIVFTKRSLVLRAIDKVGKGSLVELKKEITADTAVLFSNLDSFELASLLIDYQSPTKARPGDLAPEDIEIEAGPTDLLPGPAISELSSVGLKVAVEAGKLAVKQNHVVVKKGEAIKDNVAAVLSKLKISPMKVGFIPKSAYDAKDDKIYANISIDKKGALEELRTAIAKSLGFAAKIGYATKETISYFITKAAMEEKAIEHLMKSKSGEVA